MKQWRNKQTNRPRQCRAVFQITEIFKQPKQSAVVCMSRPHSFLNDIWTRFTYVTGDHWPPFGVRPLVDRPSDPHMMSHLMIVPWITAPALTVSSDAQNRGMKWSLFCRGTDYEWNSNPFPLNNTRLSALMCRKSMLKKFCVPPISWSFVRILISASFISLHTFCICV